MRTPWTWLLILMLVAAAACSPAKPPGAIDTGTSVPASAATVAPTSAAPASTAPKPTNEEIVQLAIRPEHLHVVEDEGEVVFEPNAGMMRADITKYHFGSEEFRAKVGSLTPERAIIVQARVVKRTERTSTPSDPTLPAPSGGFTHIDIHCEIVSVKQVRLETVVLVPERLDVDRKLDRVTLSPEPSAAERDSTTWVFDFVSFRKALGMPPKQPVAVEVEILREEASPGGATAAKTIHARILRKTP